jgi:hypothetical protein
MKIGKIVEQDGNIIELDVPEGTIKFHHHFIEEYLISHNIPFKTFDDLEKKVKSKNKVIKENNIRTFIKNVLNINKEKLKLEKTLLADPLVYSNYIIQVFTNEGNMLIKEMKEITNNDICFVYVPKNISLNQLEVLNQYPKEESSLVYYLPSEEAVLKSEYECLSLNEYIEKQERVR